MRARFSFGQGPPAADVPRGALTGAGAPARGCLDSGGEDLKDLRQIDETDAAGVVDPGTAGVRLRAMTEADLPEVMRVERAAFRYPWSEPMLRSELAHEWAHLLIAESGAPERPAIAGFIVFWIICGELHVLNVAVEPRSQRRGVGRELLGAAMTQARLAEVTYATLEVRRSNRAAIRLYESFGFRTNAVRPKYYVENDEDAFVMGLAM